MPVDMQAKLLRVLQEKEIERIGSKEATKINIRIIRSHKPQSGQEVAAGRFRLDLYYA